MPINPYQGTPRDPNVVNNLKNNYRNNTAPEFNAQQPTINRLNNAYNSPSATPNTQLAPRGNFAENPASARVSPRLYEPPPPVATPSGGAAAAARAGGVAVGAGAAAAVAGGGAGGTATTIGGALAALAAPEFLIPVALIFGAAAVLTWFKLKNQPKPQPRKGGSDPVPVGEFNKKYRIYYLNHIAVGDGKGNLIGYRDDKGTFETNGKLLGLQVTAGNPEPVTRWTYRAEFRTLNEQGVISKSLFLGSGDPGVYTRIEKIVELNPDGTETQKPPIVVQPPTVSYDIVPTKTYPGNPPQPGINPPPAVQPDEQNKRQPRTINFPTDKPLTITSPNQPPLYIPPGIPNAAPTKIKIPPVNEGQPTPITIDRPNFEPITFTAPGSSPVTISIPGSQPIAIDPTTGKQPENTTQDLTKPRTFNPISTDTPTPKTEQEKVSIPESKTQTPTNPVTTPTTPTSPNKPTTEEPKIPTLQDVINQFAPLAALTPIIQQIAQNTTKDALETAAASGTCRTTQPGGCTSNLVNGVADNINKNTNDKIDKLSAADTVIDADTNLRVRNIEDKTGSNEFPMLLPEYLMEDSLDVQVTINNQVQFNAWLLKNLSALLGMFPIKIEKENENGTKEIIKFDNVAETLAEFVGIYSKIAFDADTAVNVGIRSTAEAIGARIAGLQAGSYLKAIIDYLGFQTQPEPFPVKISCTIGAVGADGNLQETELDDFLKPSIQNVVGLDCKEQDDLHTIIKRILFDGEIARAALYKPLKPDKINNNLSITGDGIKAHRKKEEEKIDKKWEEFKSKIEGQTNLPFKVDIDEKGNNTTT